MVHHVALFPLRGGHDDEQARKKREGKELRYTVMDAEQAAYRVQINDRFWADLAKAKKQIIVDKKKFFSSNKEQKTEE